MSNGASDTPAQKTALRRHFRSLLAAMTDAECERESELVAAALRAWDAWCAARTVLLYAPTARESDVSALAIETIGAGRRLCVPAIDWESGTMSAALIDDWNADLIAGDHGVREPRAGLATVEPEELDLALVPGLAFDRTGGRLGRGAGFFDRYLSRLPSRTAVVGVCFDCQLVERVPRDSNDVAVGWLVTARGVERANNAP